MEQTEYFYSGSAWLKERLDGPEGHLWKRARKMFLFNRNLSSALNLFKFDYKALQTITRPEGTVLTGNRKPNLTDEEARQPGRVWTADAENSIRTLLDRIVTRWIPNYMYESKINIDKLHRSLTPVPLQSVLQQYDKTNNDVDSFDVDKALKTYQASLVPLHYHELWSEIVNDFRNVDTKLKERETTIDIQLFYDWTTLDEVHESALIFGTNRVTFVDSYKPLSKKLGLFDLVLIKIDNVNYFGMIVHVEQTKVKVANEDENKRYSFTIENEKKDLKFDLQTTVGIYVSRNCSNKIKQRQTLIKGKSLSLFKLSNITSSRRMISAIHNLHEWSNHRSLLKPMIDDIYFQLSNDYNSLDVTPSNGFNLAQSKTIALAESMYDDMFDHMHLIHGPPGTGKSRTIAGIVLKLLSKLPESGRKHKILLCAPSNNACDELARRILDELQNQDIPLRPNSLVRIGCQPPDDFRLCDHFLDFMILEEVVKFLRTGEKPHANIAQEKENHIMRQAKIIISTLNYCGSTRMHQLKSSTAFIIIDEASQSLEADFLLPLRFKCNKLILVGDPNQLPPCVLSDAGNYYGLSQSLYLRLYNIFQQDENGPISMLNTQYRMHPKICQFPSECFYSNRLRTDRSVGRRMRNYPLKPLYLYNIKNSPHGYDEASSSYNHSEAKYIQDFCQKLILYLVQRETTQAESESDDDDDDESTIDSSSDSFYSMDEESDYEIRKEIRRFQPLNNDDPRSIEIQQRIAVITPYKAQVRALRSYLPSYIEIMTVDSSQGKEKDIVILSCVRSGSNIGFLEDMNRLNVMLTRSKQALYVFGNLTELAGQNDSWQSFVNHAKTNVVFCDVDKPWCDLPYRT